MLDNHRGVHTTERVLDGMAILRVNGSLAADEDEDELMAFRQAVDNVLTAGCTNLAIDVSAIDTIDAEGLGELTRALRRVSGRGGRFTLIGPPQSVKRLLAVTRLDTVFTVVDTVADVATA
jgi:anti-sigma B factor antagonist